MIWTWCESGADDLNGFRIIVSLIYATLSAQYVRGGGAEPGRGNGLPRSVPLPVAVGGCSQPGVCVIERGPCDDAYGGDTFA